MRRDEHDRTNASLDNVGIKLDAAVIEKASEPVPVVQAITDGFCDQGFRRGAVSKNADGPANE
jgi:hypothetical protein